MSKKIKKNINTLIKVNRLLSQLINKQRKIQKKLNK